MQVVMRKPSCADDTTAIFMRHQEALMISKCRGPLEKFGISPDKE